MDTTVKNKRGLELVTSLPLCFLICSNYSEIYHLFNFDVLIQSSFQVNPKTAFAYFCKTSGHHDYSACQFPLQMEKVGGGLQKIEYLKEVRSFKSEIEAFFYFIFIIFLF